MRCCAKKCRRKGARFVELEWYKSQGVGNLVMCLCNDHSLNVLLEPSLKACRKNKIRTVRVHER